MPCAMRWEALRVTGHPTCRKLLVDRLALFERHAAAIPSAVAITATVGWQPLATPLRTLGMHEPPAKTTLADLMHDV